MPTEPEELHRPGRRWLEGVLRRPGLVLGAAAALAAAGAFAFVALPRDLFPSLALPTVQILLQSPGREATELELAVAQPVEQAVIGLPGVRRVTSAVQPGVVQVVVSFASASDPFRSRVLVAERLAQIAGELPEGTGAPLLTSAAGRRQEIQELVLEGPSVDSMRLRDVALQFLVPRLQSVPGVARVELLGGGERQLQVSLQPERLRTAGASLAQVLEALRGSERDAGAGVLELADQLSFVTVGSLAAEPERVRRLPVDTAHGLVPLGDLAEIREAPGLRTGLARFRGSRRCRCAS
jgi:cobalt-zinc-cadmium resistance protein CzcA